MHEVPYVFLRMGVDTICIVWGGGVFDDHALCAKCMKFFFPVLKNVLLRRNCHQLVSYHMATSFMSLSDMHDKTAVKRSFQHSWLVAISPLATVIINQQTLFLPHLFAYSNYKTKEVSN